MDGTVIKNLQTEIERLDKENADQVEQLATQGRNCEFYANQTTKLETQLASADKALRAGLDFANEVKGQIADRAIPGEIDIFTDLVTEYDNSKGSAARKDNKDNNSGCLCQRCGWRYKVDFNIPDVLWKKIKLKGSPDEGGLLCGRCIADKIEELNLYKCLYIQELSPATHFESQRDLEPDEQAAFEKHISRGDKKIGKVQPSDVCSEPGCVNGKVHKAIKPGGIWIDFPKCGGGGD